MPGCPRDRQERAREALRKVELEDRWPPPNELSASRHAWIARSRSITLHPLADEPKTSTRRPASRSWPCSSVSTKAAHTIFLAARSRHRRPRASGVHIRDGASRRTSQRRPGPPPKRRTPDATRPFKPLILTVRPLMVTVTVHGERRARRTRIAPFLSSATCSPMCDTARRTWSRAPVFAPWHCSRWHSASARRPPFLASSTVCCGGRFPTLRPIASCWSPPAAVQPPHHAALSGGDLQALRGTGPCSRP